MGRTVGNCSLNQKCGSTKYQSVALLELCQNVCIYHK